MSKFVLCGDLHFGEKGNSEKFNNQILDFLEWSCTTGKEKGATAFIQAGDWFHHRHKIDVSTLNFGVIGAKIVENAFGKDNSFVLCGNHDTYHLNSLDVNSINMLSPFVTTVFDTHSVGNITMVPWVGDGEMWDKVVGNEFETDFLIGHFEFNGFKINDAYEMTHGYSHKELKSFKKIFSGHYHTPQKKDNVVYLGTPYPITMSEANQSHGIYIFDDVSGDVEFVEYDVLKVVSVPYTEVEEYLKLNPETTNIRIEFPDDLEDETLISECVEAFAAKKFTDVKVKYTPKKLQDLVDIDEEVEEVENIDAAVLDFLGSSTEIQGIDKALLGEIYQKAIEEGNRDQI